MGKASASAFQRSALEWLQTNGSSMRVVTASCTTVANTASASTCCASAQTASGDFTVATHTSGLKTTIANHSACTIDNSGTATHVVLCAAGGGDVAFQTTCTSQALTSGTVDIPAWYVAIGDPQ